MKLKELLFLKEKPSLVLFEPPDSTEILVGRMKSFYCKAYGGVPQPIISWKINNDNKELKNIPQSEFSMENSTNTMENVFISRIDIVGTYDLEAKSLSCTVEHPMFPETFSQSVDLDIKCKS